MCSSDLNYASRLEDLSSSGDGLPLLGVAHPMFKGALLPMSRNLELTLRIEASGYFYQGEGQIVRHVINARIPLLWLALKGPLERTQRRMFVRVSCMIRAQAFLLEVDPGGESAEEKDGAPRPRRYLQGHSGERLRYILDGESYNTEIRHNTA